MRKIVFSGIAGRPDSPHNCSAVNLTQSSLCIKCLRGFDGGLPQEFICKVTQEGDDKVISNATSKTQPEFCLPGLKAGTSYRIVIYATNVKGRSKENVSLNVTTLPNTTSPSKISAGKPPFICGISRKTAQNLGHFGG